MENEKYEQLEQKIWPCSQSLTHLPLPIYADKISAGFPSPAEGYLDKSLDLNELLIKNPPATFFVRVSGDSMIGIGIHPGDLLVVDRSQEPGDGKIIIAVLEGELTVKRMRILKNKQIQLEAENSAYSAIKITPERAFQVWGVVTGVVRNVVK